MGGIVGVLWCLGSLTAGAATAATPVTDVAVTGSTAPSSPDIGTAVGHDGAHAHVGNGKGVGVGRDGVDVGGQVTVQAPAGVTVPAISVTPTVPVADPPVSAPTPSSVPTSTGPAGVASPAPVVAPIADAAGPGARSTSLRASQASAIAPVPPGLVDGALRPAHGSVASTIGVAAATVAPWLALCVLALVMRIAGLSAISNRLRRTRLLS